MQQTHLPSETRPEINFQDEIKIAAVQMSPVFLDKQTSTQKVCTKIQEAAAQGSTVVGFPESIIPGYPGWIEMLPLDQPKAHSLYQKLFLNAVEVPGPETAALGEACRAANVWAVVGITERLANTTRTLYNTQLTINPAGKIACKHRKYVPTLTERLMHTPGQTGSTASTMTPFGTLSALMCGENANPLAMYSLRLLYPVVHVASWPTHFAPGSDLENGIQNSTHGLAYSLKCFVLNCVGVIDEGAMEAYGIDQRIQDYLKQERQKSLSSIIGPDGRTLTTPLETKEGILYASVRPEDVLVPKYGMDFAGHYNRPELFAHHFENFMRQEGVGGQAKAVLDMSA
ncbi:hypothetical protein M409DRAFT_38149 [Zasmidium cellare ATCC 36951]|uniref:CN hydrolase domain-containing protein n=1 Tax=Zasmidium cellare ATCC 36951 TaxID=1080233 RepID=A0A6A6BYL4_ZASCE|nr:uncharacterized protein M409DRAFT_38149 [Zasmidium cellare ATCC 36951]KAF2158652.1 hypothetical protein M409DRAFT_38149 [Zasmidium cellare ATCC 36951]